MVCSRYPKESKYYDGVLKRKGFLKLKNNVWESKKQWKLIKKADTHYSRKIQEKYFNLWKAYREESQERKINKTLADSFYRNCLGWRVILAFRRNVEDCKISAKIYLKRFERILLERSWHKWKHYTMKRLKMKEIKCLLSKIREERLIIRLLNVWMFRLQEKRSDLQAEAKALEVFRCKLLQRYFNLWKTYWKNHRLKTEIQRLCKVYYENGLEERVFMSWKKYCLERKIYKRQMVQIETFNQNYLIKYYLNVWVEACEKKREKREEHKESLALNFLNRKMLKKSFDVLRGAAARKKMINEKTQEFFNFQKKSYISFYLNLWMEKWRQKFRSKDLESKAANWREFYLIESYLLKLVEKLNEKQEEKEELIKVINYSNAIILHRAFKGWVKVVTQKMIKKSNEENAAAFYENKLMRKSFDKWKQYAAWKSCKNIAAVHRENVLLSRAFNEWKAFVSMRKAQMKQVDSLIQKHNLELLRHAFERWKLDVKCSKEKMDLAVASWDRKKMSKIFVAMKQNAQRNMINKARCSRNVQILNDILVKSHIFRWYEITLQKKILMSRIEGVKLKQSLRLIRCYFLKWREFSDKMKTIRQKVKFFPEMKRGILLSEVVEIFVLQLKRKRNLKCKEESALKMKENLIKKKYLKRWISFICWKRKTLSKFLRESKEVKEFGRLLQNSFEKGDTKRRQPLIPDYLKSQINFNNSEVSDSFSSHSHKDNTYTVINPVNRRLPMVGQRGMFLTLNT